MWKIRLACLAYCVTLTSLLLASEPAALLGLQLFPNMGGALGVHFTAFALLGVLVAASQLPLRRLLLIGLLFTYAVGVEFLQFLVPSPVETRDLLENLMGLWAGMAIWQLAARHKVLPGRNSMPEKQRFRVLTPEGLITYDTFVLADKQPRTIKKGCILLVQEESDRQITVHRTRLVPVAAPGMPAPDPQRKSLCLACGKVQGIVEDEVVCPYHGEAACGLIETKS